MLDTWTGPSGVSFCVNPQIRHEFFESRDFKFFVLPTNLQIPWHKENERHARIKSTQKARKHYVCPMEIFHFGGKSWLWNVCSYFYTLSSKDLWHYIVMCKLWDSIHYKGHKTRKKCRKWRIRDLKFRARNEAENCTSTTFASAPAGSEWLWLLKHAFVEPKISMSFLNISFPSDKFV